MSARKEDLTNLTVEGVETPLSTAAAKKLIGLSHRGFYDALDRGQLQAVKMGGKTVVFPSEICRFLTSLRPYTPAGADWHRSNAGRLLAKEQHPEAAE